MVLWKSVFEVARKYNASTVDQNVELGLIVLGAGRVEAGLNAHFGLEDVVLFHVLVLDCFNQVLALIIVSDVGHHHSCLHWILFSDKLQSLLILANQHDKSSLI